MYAKASGVSCSSTEKELRYKKREFSDGPVACEREMLQWNPLRSVREI